MNILAIETSCDDTCISIIKVKKGKTIASQLKNLKDLEIIANVVSSQTKLHQPYGGVYPFLAKREHQKNLPILYKEIIKKTNNIKLDAIAVTIGPGLEPCLWVAANFVEELSKELKIPLITVNHIEAHILINLINQNIENIKDYFPAIALVVSGGHTQLILMNNIGKYKLIGETRDDAAGECFDKTARVLGLPYPGGPIIAQKAKEYMNSKKEMNILLPRPMLHTKDYDFSFSGLKTAVLYDYKKRTKKVRESQEYIKAMSYEIQQAIIDVLIKKTIKATKEYKAKTIILGGGVAANEELKNQLKIKANELNVNFLSPEKNLCTDNALMTAVTAYFKQKDKHPKLKKLKVNANLSI